MSPKNEDYEKFVEYLNNIFDDTTIDIKPYQGKDISINEFIDVSGSKMLKSFKLVELIVTFMMYEKEFVVIDEDYNIICATTIGDEIFKMQNIKGEVFKLAPIACFLRCDYFFKVPKGFCGYINLIRINRNVLVHSIKNQEEVIKLIINNIDLFYMLVYWFVVDYIGNKIDSNLKKILIEKIKKAKTKFRLFKLRVSSEDKTLNALDIYTPNYEYVDYLENKISELELQLEDGKINHLAEDLKRILSSVGELKEGQNQISNKLDNISTKLDELTNFVVEEQIEIEKTLMEAQKNKDIEETERIINMFSNKVISEIIKQSDGDKKYESEKEQLITTFGENNWNKLDDNSKDFLVTGKVLYSNLVDSVKMDFSGVCLLITKAVDNELHKYLYSNFKSYLRNIYHNNLSEWPSFFKKTNYYGERLISDNDFTLGSVLYFCCNNDTASEDDKNILLDYSRNALFVDTNDIEKQLKFISDKSEKIRNDYRNPAAHIKAIDKIKAEECMDYILDTTKVLIAFMKMFK